jgi:hypothetical protein
MLVLIPFNEVAQHIEIISLGRGQVVPVRQLVDDRDGRVQVSGCPSICLCRIRGASRRPARKS